MVTVKVNTPALIVFENKLLEYGTMEDVGLITHLDLMPWRRKSVNGYENARK